ncbi:MAG: MCE family protein [Myxococcaceae bacterium]|nr:MCE family protein [Myxococcaceae bacterium]MCA3015798.1 MCE family protein [Myxococcaceae bacterium]
MSTPELNPAERERRIIIRAGLFIALGLGLALLVVFVIGKERNLFDKQNVYTGAFENVDGLQFDSPVRLGGVNVGRVTSIRFGSDLGDKRIIVTMEVVKKYEARIRKDSVARITNRGVLGDKAVDISIGNPDQPALADGAELQTGTSGDISSILKATGEIIDNTVGITRDLRSGVATYTSPELQKDVKEAVTSVKNILREVETGKGLLHAVVYDKGLTSDVKAILSEASASAARLDAAVTKVDGLLADVKAGQGTLHALIYDKKIADSLTELGRAAGEVSTLVNDAKTRKDGVVYQLVYGDSRVLLSDLGQAAADVKALTAKINKGEGSLGAIINDPTVYEDLKEILGNVKRNRVLRELVRYSISNAEALDKVGKPTGDK